MEGEGDETNGGAAGEDKSVDEVSESSTSEMIGPDDAFSCGDDDEEEEEDETWLMLV